MCSRQASQLSPLHLPNRAGKWCPLPHPAPEGSPPEERRSGLRPRPPHLPACGQAQRHASAHSTYPMAKSGRAPDGARIQLGRVPQGLLQAGVPVETLSGCTGCPRSPRLGTSVKPRRAPRAGPLRLTAAVSESSEEGRAGVRDGELRVGGEAPGVSLGPTVSGPAVGLLPAPHPSWIDQAINGTGRRSPRKSARLGVSSPHSGPPQPEELQGSTSPKLYPHPQGCPNGQEPLVPLPLSAPRRPCSSYQAPLLQAHSP